MLAAAVLASGSVFLDSTIVNVALTRIGEQLPSTLFGRLEGQALVYNGYLLSLSALLILAGALMDFYGRKRTFALGLAGFGVASALCGLAPSMEALVALRALQGAAGAFLVPGSIALINTHFDQAGRPRAYGIWAAASAATTTLGPPVGGLLVDTLSWRAAFFINLPVCAVALLLTLRHVAESRDEGSSGQFDWLGAAIVALGVGGLAFGAIQGQQHEWRDGAAFAALGLGVVATAALPLWMRRSAHPLVPLDLFRSRTFTVINVATLFIYGALYVSFYAQAIFLQGTLGYSALGAGLAGLPSGIIMALASTAAGTLAGRYGARWFLIAGPTIMAGGLLWLSRLPLSSAPWMASLNSPGSLIPPLSYAIDVLPGNVAFGIGAALMVAPLTSTLMSSVPVEHSGLASAINNAISRVGPQLAGALVFVAVTASFYGGLSRQLPDVDVSQPEIRALVAPLNRPSPAAPERLQEAARRASDGSFAIAMRIAALLLLAGASVNAVGIEETRS